MTPPAPVVFLLEVDNTLLDNDRIIADLKRHLVQAFRADTPAGGAERADRYWAIFEQRRAELGYADYLGALQRYRAENPRDPNFLQISFFLLDHPVRRPPVPGIAGVIDRLRIWGRPQSCPTATWSSSRARSSVPGCSRRSRATCSSTSTRSGSWTTSRSATRPVTTCSWTEAMKATQKLHEMGQSLWRDKHHSKVGIGNHVHATDGDIGHVEDLLVDDQTRAIRYMIVDTGNWWGGHHVLVAPQWIEAVGPP